VLDTFGGSGSTLIACEQTDRICFMLELDEKYASVILRRYAEFKGRRGHHLRARRRNTPLCRPCEGGGGTWIES
jgi:DNA modification methylase